MPGASTSGKERRERTVGGWEWDGTWKRWQAWRGNYLIVVRLPRRHPPPFSAALVNVLTLEEGELAAEAAKRERAQKAREGNDGDG